jgi:hypothetical protein
MDPDHAAVQDQVLHVNIIDEMLMHIFPDVVFAPASKTFVDAVPPAILLRQQAPLGTAARNPQHGFQEKATLGFLAGIGSGMSPQKGVYLSPYSFSKSYG